MGVQDYLVMTRTFCTIGHLTAVLILFQTINNNVEASFGDGASSQDKQIALQTSMGALAFALLCFVVDIYGALSGSSLFHGTVNLIQIFFHFIGGIFLSWLITDNWNYQALWPIVISCNLPTAVAEVTVIVLLNVFKTVLY